ncbi:DUF11 domain-containing protein [Marinicella meishanensis]|uniref:DUF11 domain-containing protein n=1 Tax=Marinicella meishanensis TaxID=2873263 RepID=UPI001CBCBCDC|nr:DUF11 domain-containing protein [Marinicella sp. NBU2979]
MTIGLLGLLWSHSDAAEVTLQNDSLVDFSQGAIQSGFVANELGAAWLESPCDGDLVAVQIFWRSLNGGSASTIEQGIGIFEAGTFPEPGMELETIVGPVLNDGVFNEYRFLDENSVIPLIVPVTQGETYVIAFQFENTPIPTGPSLVTDADGCQTGKNSIFAIPPNLWFDSCLLGVSGDFVIRAVVDCPVVANEVDLAVSQMADPATYVPGDDLTLSITISNAGPAAANATSVIDFFPSELNGVQWMCTPNNGAACGMPTGNGNLTESVNLPANSQVVFEAVGTMDVAATGTLSNTAQVIVPVGTTDTDPANNAFTLEVLMSGDDLIFADDFE